jgi:hypothetical protein
VKVHVLIRGDRPNGRPGGARGAGLRPLPKGVEWPPEPAATRTALSAAMSGVIGQKSAEARVVGPGQEGRAGEGPNILV